MEKNTTIYSTCLLVLLISGTCFAGCTDSTIANPGVAGTYVNEENSKQFIELNSDGTFYLKEGSYGYHGKWEMKANMLRLHTDMMGTTIEMEKVGNTLYSYDTQGRVIARYVRQ